MKIAFLSNYTINFIVGSLKKLLGSEKISSEIYVPGFNQYSYEILSKDSGLCKFNPEIIFVPIDFPMLLDDLIQKSINWKEIAEKTDNRFWEYINQLEILSKNFPNSKIIVDNVWFDSIYSSRTLEYNSYEGISTLIQKYNNELSSFVLEKNNILIADINSLINKYGEKQLYDRRMFYISKNRWSAFGIEQVSALYFNHLKAYKGIRKKCIVLDLDNTLWGGIIGQDGKENILLGNDGIGKSYYDFQNALLKLYKRGIILAICSKNNVNDALELMKDHPYMMLRPEYFTILKINWNNKDINIREIAQELNIGLDSIVFLDDSQFERELIATQLPEVAVPALPEDPSFFTEFLNELNYFNFHSLSEEDLTRNKSYQDNLQRKKSETSFSNIEDYYHSLEMKVLIKSIDEFSLPRVVQLINKTNQFNLTTQRYTEADVRTFIKNDDYNIFNISLNDKFGENGIIGVVITIKKNDSVFIDTFLLSCRVIGRTVETAILSYIAEKAKVSNASFLIGQYIATTKNESCKELYRVHNFKEKENNIWEFNLCSSEINCPDWIKLIGE